MNRILEKAERFLEDAARGKVDTHAISWFATSALSGSNIPLNSDLGYELSTLANMALGPEHMLDRYQLILTLHRLKYWADAKRMSEQERATG